jgi:hypothetical protein
VPLETTAPARMQRAAIQACLSPVFLPNVVLAGERRLVAQLHRPLARTAPTVAGLYSCLWVFLRTGTMPITNPSSTQPPLPAKIQRNAVSISAPVSREPTLAHSAMQPPVDHETM